MAVVNKWTSAVIAAIIFLAFLPVLKNEFHFDDGVNIVANPPSAPRARATPVDVSTLFRGHYRPCLDFVQR